ncbi:hypothetical protein TNCV_155601 [Trichonephila clavipes]|nr:hypothetical protein TNCV_155601 [Trichonephila clavipes]
MTSARGHGVIVYCLNSGSDDIQSGHHNGKGETGTPLTIGEACLKRIASSFLVFREGDNRNRWRDGQVCPDVGQGIMAPWARRPGCVLGCYAQIGRGRPRETFETEKKELERRARPWREKKEKALDRESMRGEPWLKRTGREH